MSIQVNIGEAKDRLSQLVAAAVRGEDVVLRRAGVPQVRLVPVVTGNEEQQRQERADKLESAFGAFRGKIDMGIDWEAPSMTDEEVARMGIDHPWADDD